MKIYTKTGDDGTTGLFAGPRVAKDHPRIDVCGTVDELNAMLGVVRSETTLDGDVYQLLTRIQRDLFCLGAELSTPDPAAHGTALLADEHVRAIEAAIDTFDGRLPALEHFILPGGTRAAAELHMARTICRRAERRVVALAAMDDTTISDRAIRYLNRLSDLLFMLARAVNAAAGQADMPWPLADDKVTR